MGKKIRNLKITYSIEIAIVRILANSLINQFLITLEANVMRFLKQLTISLHIL